MWTLGLAGLALAAVGLVALLNRGRTPAQLDRRWDVVSLGNAYAAVAATLVSFSVITAVFLANFSRVADPASVENVMALFLLSFIALVADTLMFATVRSAQQSDAASPDMALVRQVMYVLATTAFFFALTLSWLGLHPVLLALDLPNLAGVFTWILLFALTSGALRQGAWFRVLPGATVPASYAVAAVPLLLAAGYRLVLVPAAPWLWPPDATLTLAVAAWLCGAVPFSVETLMIRFYGGVIADTRLIRLLPGVLPPYLAAGLSLLACLWFSLVMPTP